MNITDGSHNVPCSVCHINTECAFRVRIDNCFADLYTFDLCVDCYHLVMASLVPDPDGPPST